MASGTPVVAIDRGALSEIVEDAGFVVSKENQAMEALMTLLTKTTTREVHKKKAIARAKMFTSQEFARKVLDVVEKV